MTSSLSGLRKCAHQETFWRIWPIYQYFSVSISDLFKNFLTQ